MSTRTHTSARGVVATFIILMSTLLVVTVAVEDEAAAFQAVDTCSSATPDSCYDLVVECDTATPGQGLLTVSYAGVEPLVSASVYADGLGGFYTANEYPASFSLTDGSWNVSTFGSTATQSLSLEQSIWVSCGYVCTTGDMDNCAPVCDIDGAGVADECFVAAVECAPNGFITVALGATTSSLVGAGAGDWEAQLTTYSDNMQVNAQTIGFASTDDPTFVIDPLPNGAYRVVIELVSLVDSTLINGAVSGTLDCGVTPCPAGECEFEFFAAELTCTGDLSLVITGSVPVLSIDQVETIVIMVNGQQLPDGSIFGLSASDLEPPYPNGDGVRETIYINAADDTITAADTYEIMAMIDGTSIYNQTFNATLIEQVDGSGCADVTVDCASLTVSAQVLLAEDPGAPGYYEIPGLFADSVQLIVYDANGFIVDWAPQRLDNPYQELRVTNPLTASLAGAAQPLTWQIGHSIDWGFFSAEDVARIANGELQEVWYPWEEGTVECAPPTFSITPTVVACTSSTAPNGSIELTPTLANGATLASITLDGSGEQRAVAPYAWTGLTGGVYSFTADSNPVIAVEQVTVPDCPVPAISFTAAMQPCTNYAGNAEIELTPMLTGGASLTSITLVETGEELTSAPFIWDELAGGSYSFTAVSNPAGTPDPVTVEPCPEPTITVDAVDATCATTIDGTIAMQVSVTAGASLTITIDGVPHTFEAVAPTSFTWTGLAADTYTPDATAVPGSVVLTGLAPILVPSCVEPSIVLSSTATCATSGDLGSITIDVETFGGAAIDGLQLLGAPSDLIAAPGPYVWTGLNGGLYQIVASRPEPASAELVGQGLVMVPDCDDVAISATVLPCTSLAEPDGSIELTIGLLGAASLASITLVQTGEQLTDAPFVWGGLSGGVYTFVVDSSPGAAVDPVTIDPCPVEPATVTFTPTFECVLGTGIARGSVLLDVDGAGVVTFAGVRLVETGAEIVAPGPYLFDDLPNGTYTFELIDPFGPAEAVTEASFLLPYCTTGFTKCSSNAVGEGRIDVRQLDLDDQMSVTLDATGETLTGPGPLIWTGLLPGIYTFSTSGTPVGITIQPFEVALCESSVADVVVECESAAFAFAPGVIEAAFSAGPGASMGRVELNPGGDVASLAGGTVRFWVVEAGDYTIDFIDAHPSIESIPVTVPVCPEAVFVEVNEECPGGDQPAVATFDVVTIGGFTYSGVELIDFESGDQLAFQSSPGPYQFSMPPGPSNLVLTGASVVDHPGAFNLMATYNGRSCAELDVFETQSTCSSGGDGTLTVELTTQRPDFDITILLGGTSVHATAAGPTAAGSFVAEFLDLAAGTYPLYEYVLGLNTAASLDGLAIFQDGFMTQSALKPPYRPDVVVPETTIGEVEVLECVPVAPEAVVIQCAVNDTGSISFDFPGQPDIASIELIESGATVAAPGPWEWTGLAAGAYTFVIDGGESLTMEPLTVSECPRLELDFDILCSSGTDGRVTALAQPIGGVQLQSLTFNKIEAGQVVDSQTAPAPGPFVFDTLAPGLYRVAVDSEPLVDWSESVLVPSCSVYAQVYLSPSCNSISLQLGTIGGATVSGITMQPGDRPVGNGATLTLLGNLDPGTYTFEVESHPAITLDPIEILGCPEITVQTLSVTCNSGGLGSYNGEIRLSVSTSGPVVLSGMSLGGDTITGPGPYVWTGLSAGSKTIEVDNDAELSLDPVDVPNCPEFGAPSVTVDCDADGAHQVRLFVLALNGAEVDSITLSPGGQTFSGPGPYTWTGMKPGSYTFDVVSRPALVVDPVLVGSECPSVSLSPTWLCTGPGVSTVFANVETTGLQTVNSVSFGYWNGGLTPTLVAPDTIVAPGPYKWNDVTQAPSGIAYGLTVDASPLELETWLVIPGGCEVDSVQTPSCASPGIADGSVKVALVGVDVAGSDAAGVQEVTIEGDSLQFTRRVEAPGPYVFDELEAGAYVVQIGKIPNELARHEVLVRECAQAVAVTASCTNGANGTITIAVTGKDDVKITVDSVTKLNVGTWTGLPVGTYVVTASETVADLPTVIEVPKCPTGTPLIAPAGGARAIISATCDVGGNAVVEVTEDEVFGTVVVGFAINGTFGSRQIVPNGDPIHVVILTANANDNTSLSGPSVAPFCPTVSQASSEPEGPQFIVLPVPPPPAVLVAAPVSPSAGTGVSVPLPEDFLAGVTPPNSDPEDDGVAAEEPEVVAAVPEPAPTKNEPDLASSSSPVPLSIPGEVSAGITASGPSEIVLPAACDIDDVQIDGVTNLVRDGHTETGLPRFTTDGASLDVGTHRFEVDCDGALVNVELFVYRQIGGSRGEGNSVARLAALSGLLLLVITGATSVAKSKFADISMGGTDI